MYEMKLLLLTIIITTKLFDSSKAEESELEKSLGIDEDATLTTPELITKYGYPVETHFVITEDDYILQLHRIPHGKSKTAAKTTGNRTVAFLQHGLLGDSTNFILTGVHHGLGYNLADQGYDVWMGNSRGNTYSRNHTSFDPSYSHEFWDFSFHEVGVNDLPAMIDYVLEQTGQENLFFVGHSQGSTALIVLTSMRPEYNDKIIAGFHLGPIAYMSHIKGPVIKLLAFWQKPLGDIVDFIGKDEFLASSKFMEIAGSTMCNDNDTMTQPICTNVYFMLMGFNKDEMNATFLPVLLGHVPAGTSANSLLHYAQLMQSGKFRQFDRGFCGNLLTYSSFHPPSYDLTEITTPMYLFYSDNDWFSSEVDVLRFHDEIATSELELFHCNHADYVFGNHVPVVVSRKIIRLMKELQ